MESNANHWKTTHLSVFTLPLKEDKSGCRCLGMKSVAVYTYKEQEVEEHFCFWIATSSLSGCRQNPTSLRGCVGLGKAHGFGTFSSVCA